jgi:periplasmic copper chaperone A
MNKKPLLFLGFLLALLLAGCSQSESAEGIVVTDVWGRPSPSMAANGAFYMNIRNNSSAADRLVRAESAACGAVELHESVMEEGVMRMVHVGEIELPPDQTTELKVGGLHVPG